MLGSAKRFTQQGEGTIGGISRLSRSPETKPMRPPLSEPQSACPFCLGEPRHDWASLIADRPARPLRRGAVLYTQGDLFRALHIVLRGRIRLVRYTPDGHERHLMVIGPGGLLGDEGASQSGFHACTAVASSEALVVELPWPQAMADLQAEPTLLGQYLAFSNQRLQALLMHHDLLSHGGAGRRVATALLGLLHSHGQAHPAGRLIRINFTQEEMACLCSLSRMSVSSVMTELLRRRVLSREGRLYVAMDPAALQALAQA